MRKFSLTTAAAICMFAATTPSCSGPDKRVNPFMESYDTPFNIPPFDKITYDDYMPAIKEGIAQRNKEIEAIVSNPETPDFNNTILAMEKSGNLLSRVMLVFSSLDETDSSPEMVKISEEAYPLYSQHNDEIMINDSLFQRVKYVYDHREEMGLKPYEQRAVEESYKQFVRNGALLSEADKEALKKCNTELTDLYLQFNKNLLDDTNAFELVVDDESQLSGIPASNIAMAAEEAKTRGKEGKWVFTLHAPSRLPLLQYADNRELRQKM